MGPARRRAEHSHRRASTGGRSPGLAVDVGNPHLACVTDVAHRRAGPDRRARPRPRAVPARGERRVRVAGRGRTATRWRCGCTSAAWGRPARAAPAPSPPWSPRCAPPGAATGDGRGATRPGGRLRVTVATGHHRAARPGRARRAGELRAGLVGRGADAEAVALKQPESRATCGVAGGSMPHTMTESALSTPDPADRPRRRPQLDRARRLRARGAQLAAPRRRALHRAHRRHRGRVPAAAPRARRARRRVDRGQRRAGAGVADRAGPPRRDRRLRGARRPRPAAQPARPGHLHRLRQGRRAARRRARRRRRHRDLRRRALARPAAPARGEAQGQGHRPDRADPRHLRPARPLPRRQGAGRAGPAVLPAAAPARVGRGAVPAGRWSRRRRRRHRWPRPR